MLNDDKSLLPRLRRVLLLGAPLPLLLIAGTLAAGRSAIGSPQTVQYNRDIRPILSDNCFFCHGPDKNTRKAELRLDQRTAAVNRGAIIPGRPERSSLVQRILATDKYTVMPPVDSHKKLTTAQKKLLTQWIKEGAAYEAHWAYIAPKRPAVPKLTNKAKYPVRNAVDAFVFSKLAQKGIAPSPEADKRTLIRRVSLDLTGLPPTPEELRAFLADKSPNAYEKVVDRLLASPHYGERMAVPWLDVVRYSDTVGFHGDQNQNAWAYRDYVVDSFNKNKPFDRFTIEQIAGDLLPNATPEQKTATAFNRLNMMTREGGAQDREYIAKSQADRVRTVSMAFLGSTFGCAECHDHKFDPITARDFYSMAAFFGDVRQWGVYADYGYTPNPDLKGYNNDYPFPPEIKVRSRYLTERIARQQKRIEKLAAETAKTLETDAAAKAAFDAWRTATRDFLKRNYSYGWQVARLTNVAVTNPAPKKNDKPAETPPPAPAFTAEKEKGTVILTDQTPANVEVSFYAETPYIAALLLEVLPEKAQDGKVLRKGTDAATLTMSATLRREGSEKPEAIRFRHATANIAAPRYDNGFEILGVHRGWRIENHPQATVRFSVWLPDKPLSVKPGDIITVTFPNMAVGRVRIAVSPFVPENPDSVTLPRTASQIVADNRYNGTPPRTLMAALEKGDSPLVLRQYLFGTAWNEEAFKKAKALEADIIACRQGITPVLVTESVKKPLVTRILPRGNWQDESGPIVPPAVPGFLARAVDKPRDRTLTRLDLAKWIVAPENPLTSRVFVNRLWKQYFGNGLSLQVEDLGAQGEWPTHPELLDWLAVEFREKGWNVKHMARLMVTSATYRQSSSLRKELQNIDPSNRLLASQNPRRLEAEFVRDNALFIAGLLNRDRGGPPVKPYQPADYYANLQFPDRNYIADTDDRQWRRGVYMHWQRTFLHPMLANFDAPSREDCTAARTAANTPQQALTLLNDPQFVEAARVFAARLLAVPNATDEKRLGLAFEKAVARPIKAKEKASLLRFLKNVREEYRQRPDDAKKLMTVGFAPAPANADPVELASWTSVCRVLLNLNETITRY